MKRHPISPKITARQARMLAAACSAGGDTFYMLAPDGSELPNMAAFRSLLLRGLVVAASGDERVKRIVATPLGRWRALGGKPPKET